VSEEHPSPLFTWHRCSALKDGVRISMKLFDPKWVDPYSSGEDSDEDDENNAESDEEEDEEEEVRGGGVAVAGTYRSEG
jgi:hypothetical protein